MKYNLTQAAKAVGIARSTLYRDIESGVISISKDSKGKSYITPIELERVYGTVQSCMSKSISLSQTDTYKNNSEIGLLRDQLQKHEETIIDLRKRLDQSELERRSTQEKLTCLLTDQRKKSLFMRILGK